MAIITDLWITQTTVSQHNLAAVNLELQITLQGQQYPISVPFPTTTAQPEAGQSGIYHFPIGLLGTSLDDSTIQTIAIAVTAPSVVTTLPAFDWLPASLWTTSLNVQGQYRVLTGDPQWPASNSFDNAQLTHTLTLVPTTAPLYSMVLPFSSADDSIFGNGDSALAFGVPNPFSIEIWVNTEIDDRGSSMALQLLFQPANEYYYLSVAANGQFTLAQQIADTSTATGQPSTSGPFKHLAITYDGDTVKLYLDGIFTLNLNVSQLDAAWLRNSTLSYFFDGLVKAVRIWSLALTEAQIQANLTQKPTGSEIGLAGYWWYSQDMLTPGGGSSCDSDSSGQFGASASLGRAQGTYVSRGRY